MTVATPISITMVLVNNTVLSTCGSLEKKNLWPPKFCLTTETKSRGIKRTGKGLEMNEKKGKGSLCGFIQRRPVAHLQEHALKIV